ncbi:MYND-type domain-containing protein [Caerostris extrusa]|uniref:MYND-type domain-containing protein n=1 Tax=Caerostris extrusa TaxID=172846 RepID=A0AAV4PYU4_CAEEX|nr:MYND-type domain-containing protein [Caerostris extrusa]
MCESRERTRVANQQSKGSAACSGVGKPPELMHIKRHSLAEELNKILKKDRFRENNDPPPPQEVAINLSCGAVGKTSKPQDIPTDRYSDSEDSDCGLVIDLDRRLSVEERVPSPTFQNSEESDDTVILSKLEESSIFPSSDNQDNAVFMPTRDNCIRSTGRIPTEDACLLLHLSRSAVPPIANNVTETLPENKPVPLEVKKTEKPSTEPKEQNTETKEPDKDESILRTLLLDNGSSQETSYQPQPGPSMPIPSDSKDEMQFNENLRKLMFQACQLSSNNSSTELDEKRLEQLQTDINANVISEAEEESNDPRVIRDRIQKLRNEILFLQQMANQKDKERVSIMCYKRYKEELLKKLSPSDEQTSYDPNHPAASTSSAFTCISSSEDVLPFSPSYQLLRLAYHPTLRTNGPSATITSSDSLEESQCGEVLPPVDTMIANASENYGVDMRTVSRSGSNTSSLTQDVLSNRDSMYNSFTAGSSLSSVQLFQTSRESAFSPSHSRSPSLPELSPSGRSTHHFTSSSGSSTSQSPPSLQPEFRLSGGSSFMPISSSFHAHYPLPLVVPSSNNRTESSRLHPASSASGKPHKETTKHSPKSSPKSRSRSSYSKWTSVHTGRNTSTAMDLHTEHINVQKSTITQTHSSHSLRIVPPPTTLHSFTKHSVPPQQCDSNSRQQSGHQSRTEVPHENSLRRHIQNIFHRKTAEESRVSPYPPMMNPSDSIIYRGHNNTLSSVTVNSDTGGPPRCMSCGYADAKFICSGCRKQWYCSAKCQTDDWPYHSTACFASQYKSSENSNYS